MLQRQDQMNPREPYDYSTAGFDSFLSRSIDNLSQANLDSQGPVSTQIRFDSAQISGALGDTLKIGNISLNGAQKNIILSDGNVDRILIGFDQDGF